MYKAAPDASYYKTFTRQKFATWSIRSLEEEEKNVRSRADYFLFVTGANKVRSRLLGNYQKKKKISKEGCRASNPLVAFTTIVADVLAT